MTKQEIPYFMQLFAVFTLCLFGFGYFGIRHLPKRVVLVWQVYLHLPLG